MAGVLALAASLRPRAGPFLSVDMTLAKLACCVSPPVGCSGTSCWGPWHLCLIDDPGHMAFPVQTQGLTAHMSDLRLDRLFFLAGTAALPHTTLYSQYTPCCRASGIIPDPGRRRHPAGSAGSPSDYSSTILLRHLLEWRPPLCWVQL